MRCMILVKVDKPLLNGAIRWLWRASEYTGRKKVTAPVNMP
jgi:hypothetical protein